MENLQKIQFENLKKSASGIWAERILAQLGYAMNLSKARGGKYDGVIEEAMKYLYERFEEDGAVTKAIALNAEGILGSMSSEAKSLHIICAAHAHIDMNWMWGYAETVAVTLDTFRTMLNIMKEYPDFKFSQSQASVYSIVEEYDPEMLQEIKSRVKEGRWEVTASAWVETDKNMPNGESLARHILYTKKYLSKLLDISPDSLQIDFEPDTFGHNRNVPEIMRKGGVKYYYHCRGYDSHNIYKWQSPSGSSVIVYREPLWYNAAIDKDIALHVPEFCSRHGLDTVLKVYGVGDHGGGPTRRDIEKLIEMAGWPVFPSIRFGTFAEFFNLLESISDKLPVVYKELNFIFTGCYTTQTRIKLANRISEAKLNEAEMFSTFSNNCANGVYPYENYEMAWKKILFNHFHDILPGSGVIETREYSMGQFQQVLAIANTGISKALRNISSQIDTSSLPVNIENLADTISEGAGVGYALQDYGIPQTDRGAGVARIFHLYNPSTHERHEPVELTVWDWPGEMNRIEVVDVNGNPVKYQLLTGKAQQGHQKGDYWGHKYMILLIDARLPSCGYNTYILHEKEIFDDVIPDDYPRIEKVDRFVMENDYVKVTFDTHNASVISMLDKKTGREMVNKPSCLFRLIDEDDSKGMSAWIVGRYMNITNIDKDIKIRNSHLDTHSLRQWISYKMNFKSSSLHVKISLDANSSRLNFDIECDWQEKADPDKLIPQLNFHIPFVYRCKQYKFDIPFGTIMREPLDMDVPANSFAVAIPDSNEGSAIMLVSNSKYGFRAVDNSLSLNLIRSSSNPDPYPENGIHKFHFAIDIVENYEDNTLLINKAYDYNHPISFISGQKKRGALPMGKSFMKLLKGTVAISSVKLPEDKSNKRQMIVRLYETSGETTQAAIKFSDIITKAWFVDVNEKEVRDNGDITICGDVVKFDVYAYSMVGICVEF